MEQTVRARPGKLNASVDVFANIRRLRRKSMRSKVEEDGDAGIRLDDIDQPGVRGRPHRRGESQSGRFVGEVREGGLVAEREKGVHEFPAWPQAAKSLMHHAWHRQPGRVQRFFQRIELLAAIAEDVQDAMPGQGFRNPVRDIPPSETARGAEIRES